MTMSQYETYNFQSNSHVTTSIPRFHLTDLSILNRSWTMKLSDPQGHPQGDQGMVPLAPQGDHGRGQAPLRPGAGGSEARGLRGQVQHVAQSPGLPEQLRIAPAPKTREKWLKSG